MDTNKMIENMDEREYHAHPAWSQTKLKKFLESPRKYMHSLTEPKAPTPAQSLGSIVHTLALQPHEFGRYYVATPCGLDLRKKDDKALYTDLQMTAEGSGLQIVRGEIADQANRIRDAIYQHDQAREIMEMPGIVETAFFAELQGLSCRGKIDKVIESADMIVDIKTCADGNAEAEMWGKMICKFSYDMQAVMYPSLYQKVYDKIISEFVHIVVETEAPYVVQVYEIPEEFKTLGRVKLLTAMDMVKECEASGVYPNYVDKPLSLPSWEGRKWLGDGFFNHDNAE